MIFLADLESLATTIASFSKVRMVRNGRSAKDHWVNHTSVINPISYAITIHSALCPESMALGRHLGGLRFQKRKTTR